MRQTAFHAVIGVLTLKDLELRLQVRTRPTGCHPEEGNELSGDGHIVGAAREALHVLEAKDSAQIAISLEWLDNSLLQLQKAVRTAAVPVEKPEPTGR